MSLHDHDYSHQNALAQEARRRMKVPFSWVQMHLALKI